jgi:hypothetical protein
MKAVFTIEQVEDKMIVTVEAAEIEESGITNEDIAVHVKDGNQISKPYKIPPMNSEQIAAYIYDTCKAMSHEKCVELKGFIDELVQYEKNKCKN